MILKVFKSGPFWVILVLICTLGIRSYRAVTKEALFMDECLSVILANYTDYGWGVPVAEHDIWQTGEELNVRIFGGDNSPQGVASAVVKLRESTRDTPHTNLYYSLLKISFLGTDTSVPSNLIFRGVALNILFFLIGFFLLFRLGRLLFPDKYYLVILLLCVASLSPVSIGTTMLIRDYQLQELLLILYTYIFVICFLKILKKENILNLKTFVLYSLAIALLSLSGYFLIIYMLLLGGVLIVLTIYVEKRILNKPLLSVFAVLILSVILIYAIYPNFSEGLTDYRGAEALSKLTLNNFSSNISVTMLEMLRQIKAYYTGVLLTVITLALAVGAWCLREKKGSRILESYLPLILALCAVIWTMIVFYTAPFKEIRYTSPVFPVISLFFPYFVSFYERKQAIVLAIIFSLLFFAKGLAHTEVYWGRRLPSEYYIEHEEIPLLVGGVFMDWMQSPLSPFFSKDRKIKFLHNPDSFKQEINKFDEVFVLVHRDLTKEYLEIPTYEIVDDILRGDTGWFYRGYIFKKKK